MGTKNIRQPAVRAEIPKGPKEVRADPTHTPTGVQPDRESQPVEIYEQESDLPLILEGFGVNPPFGFNGLDEREQEKYATVDKYLREGLRADGRKETVKNYLKALRGLEKKLEIDDGSEEMLERMYGFVSAYNRVTKIQGKDVRDKVLKMMYKVAKGKDFDADELSLRIQEDYLREGGHWK